MNIELCMKEVEDMAAFLNESGKRRAADLQTEKENWEKQQLEPWHELIQLIERAAADYPSKVYLDTTAGKIVFGAAPVYRYPAKSKYLLRTHSLPVKEFSITDGGLYSLARGTDPSDLLPKLIMILAELIR